MNIKPSSHLNLEIVDAGDQTKNRVETLKSALSTLARLEQISLKDVTPSSSAQIVIGEATYCLPLEGVIDFAEERSRLEKEISKLQGEIKRLEGKLGNEKFVANAPEKIVQEEREKLSDYNQQIERVRTAFERIAG